MKKIAILGAGMAGYGASARLHQEGLAAAVYEKENRYGGHTRSYAHDTGFVSDDGPHVSFTKDERIQELLVNAVGGNYETIQVSVNNYWRGHWIKHPAICNLHGLANDIVVRCIRDFVEAQEMQKDSPPEIATYEDWLLASYGRGFYENFPKDYTIRYHTVEPKNMSTDWLGPRLYQADLGEVVRGALTPETEDVHYISGFRYPKGGGFQSYLKPFTDWVDIQLGHKLVKIDSKDRKLFFSNGNQIDYDFLISSIALPDLVPMLDGVPQDVLDAAESLACTSRVDVNVGINNDSFTEACWSYFYDMDYSFTRVSYPHKLSKSTCPNGCGAFQAEVYFSKKYKPMKGTAEDYIEPVIGDLRRCGLIQDHDKILFKNATYTEYANVIFDLERGTNLAIVHGYLDDLGIRYCGRYGEWGYMWTDDSFKSGERAAQSVLDEMSS